MNNIAIFNLALSRKWYRTPRDSYAIYVALYIFKVVPYGRSRSHKVIKVVTSRKAICDFLLAFHCNYMPIFYRFRDITIYWSKIYGFSLLCPRQSRLNPSLAMFPWH